MAQQGTGIYNTVMSYVPGTEEYRKSSQSQSEEEHHTYNNADGTTNNAGNTAGGQSGDTSTGYGQGTGGYGNNDTSSKDYGNTGTGQGTNTDSGYGKGDAGNSNFAGNTYGAGNTYASGNKGDGYGSGNTGNAYDNDNTGNTYGGGNTGNTYDSGNAGRAGTAYGSSGTDATGNASDGYSKGTAGAGADQTGQDYKKPQVFYEDDDSAADDTGTHHSGYNPQSSVTPDNYAQQGQGQDDGVRGAPIEGENVKGYAIGSQVGSGDTENPTRPGDPSGQVAGSHLEYGPKDTDTRDASGRGTVNQSKGTGDSSFANVKTDDGQGNSSHVVSRSSTSTMKSSSVTQL